MATSEALKRAQRKYEATHTRAMTFRFNLRTDKDILDKFESIDNVAGYLKRLIREDIASNG